MLIRKFEIEKDIRRGESTKKGSEAIETDMRSKENLNSQLGSASVQCEHRNVFYPEVTATYR